MPNKAQTQEKQNQVENQIETNIWAETRSDIVKSQVLNVLEWKKAWNDNSVILQNYWVGTTRWREYEFLKEIDNLPLYIDILSRVFHTRWWKVELEILRRYKYLWMQKWLMEKINFLWLWIFWNDLEIWKPHISWPWIDDSEKFLWAFSKAKISFTLDSGVWIEFLKNFDIEKYSKYADEIMSLQSKDKLIARILNSSDFRDLLTSNFDKYIKIREIIPKFNYFIDEWIQELFYNILKVENIDEFIDTLQTLKTPLSWELFIMHSKRVLDFYNKFGTNWLNNIKYLNSILDKKIDSVDLLIWKLKNTDYLFKIETDALEKVIEIFWKEKFKIDEAKAEFAVMRDIVFSRIYDKNRDVNGFNDSKKAVIPEYLYKKFWEKIFFLDKDDNESEEAKKIEEETKTLWLKSTSLYFMKKWNILKTERNKNLLVAIFRSKLEVWVLESFIDKYNINWEDWIKFLEFIFIWDYSDENIVSSWWMIWLEPSRKTFLSKNIFSNFQILSEKIPDIFSYDNFINNYLNDKSLMSDLVRLIDCNPDNYIFFFHKFKEELLKNPKDFFEKINHHISSHSEWFKNYDTLDQITGLDISLDDFLNRRILFPVWIDLERYFRILKYKFWDSLKTLDDFEYFNNFYSEFPYWLSDKQENLLDKLLFTKEEFNNIDILNQIKDMNDLIYLDYLDWLVWNFWEDITFKYLWDKLSLKQSLNLSTYLIQNKNSVEELMLYLWEKSNSDFYNFIYNFFKEFSKKELETADFQKLIKLMNIPETKFSPAFAVDFIDTKNEEEENNLIQEYSKLQDELLTLKVTNDKTSWLTKWLLNEVYPQMNYSPRSLDDYSDQTSHLDEYTFDRNWYKMIFTGLNWYKIKDWYETNNQLMELYRWRVQNISSLAFWNGENIKSFIESRLPELKTKTLEGNIIEYIKFLEEKNNELKIDDMDIILAYQLIGKIDSFFNALNDKTRRFSDENSKNAIQLEALISEYWDNLKETINSIEKKTLLNESLENLAFLQKTDLDIKSSLEYKNLTKTRLLEQIIKWFISIPKDKLNLDLIRKSLKTRFLTTLQTNPKLQEFLDELVSAFQVEDFYDLDKPENVENLKLKLEKVSFEFLSKNKWIDLDLKMIQNLQWEIYVSLKNENDKYEEIKEQEIKSDKTIIEKSTKDRNVTGYFAKTREQAMARAVWQICIWWDSNMWINPNYFEFVLMDIDRKQNIGTTMLLKIEDNNKKYLLFWPNPSEEFVAKVSARDLYYQILNQVIGFAENNNFDWIILDKEYGHSTNRWWTFQTTLENSILKDNSWTPLSIDLQKSHKLWWSYSYQNWLNFVWRK